MDREAINEIRASRTGYNERGAEYYFKVFNLGENGEAVKGRRILDVGAGQSNFADTVNSLYGENTVVRVDPFYPENPPTNVNGAVTATAQVLPFRDEALDEVLALWSVYWVKHDLDKALQEMLRVTKRGGKVKIRPALVKKFMPNPLELSDLIHLYPFQEPSREYYYTAEIDKNDQATEERLAQEIKKLTEFLDFSPGNKTLQNDNFSILGNKSKVW